MAKIIAGLGAQLGLDTTEFKKGISEAKSSLKELKEYLPEALSAVAFYEMIHASLEYANQIVETAKANDVMVSSVMELSEALERNGGKVEDTSRIYSGFTTKLEAAIAGNQQAQESFLKLGVTLTDLRNLSEQDLFQKTVSGLANMDDAAQRNGLAFQTLGKAIRGVDIKGLASTMGELKGSMDSYANSVSMAHELSLKLQNSQQELMLEFTKSVIPTLNTLYDSFHKTGTALNYIADAVKYIAMVIAVTIKEIATGIVQLYDVLKMLGKWAIDFSNLRFKEAGKDLSDGFKEIREDGQKYLDFIKDLDKANKDIELPEIKKPQNEQRTVVNANAAGLLSAKDLTAEYIRQTELMNTQLAQKDKLTTLSKNEREQQAAENAVLDAKQKALDAIDKKIANLDKNKIGYEDVKKELLKAKENIKDITVFAQESAKNVVIANQKAQESFWMGWENAYKNYIESTQTAADSGRQVFESLTSNMTKALEDFVATGKLSFSDLARSIISDLLKIYVKYQETQLFSALGDAYKGAGGAQGLLAGAKSLLGFADGGDPPVGVPSIVGENGPELFIPKTAGTVIPNSALSGMGGGGQTINYNGPFVQNLSAIDTQSGVQFLTQNKNVIWAANQSANRSIPMTR